MENSKILIFISIVLFAYLLGCSEGREFDSLEVRPETYTSENYPYCCPYNSDATCDNGSGYTANGYRYFEAIGVYSDDSEEDLTDEVTWETDASDDSVLSSTANGLVWCNKITGAFSISAKYTLSSSDSGTSSESSTTYSDSVIVEVDVD